MPPRFPGGERIILVARKADVSSAPEPTGDLMGAGGTSLSRVQILAFHQVRYGYTCMVMFFGTRYYDHRTSISHGWVWGTLFGKYNILPQRED